MSTLKQKFGKFISAKRYQPTQQELDNIKMKKNIKKGCYQFQFKYFDAWRLKRLKRYLDWQLPERELQVQLSNYSHDEYSVLREILAAHFNSFSVPGRLKIADFSSGIGRSTAFFKNMFNLNQARFFLFDGNKKIYGPKTEMQDSQRHFHTKVDDIFSDNTSFYTDFELVDCFLESNNVSRFQLVDLAAANQIEDIQSIGPVDLLYSFHAVGYHWEMSAVFDYYKLDKIIAKGSLLVFGLRRKSDPHGYGDDQFERIEQFLSRGYEKVDVIEGELLQRFLILRKK